MRLDDLPWRNNGAHWETIVDTPDHKQMQIFRIRDSYSIYLINRNRNDNERIWYDVEPIVAQAIVYELLNGGNNADSQS